MGKGIAYCAMLVALAGCQSAPVVRVPVEVTRTVYVPIDPALTADCPIPGPGTVKLPDRCQAGTGCEVLAVASARKAALKACNGKLRAIRGIEGTPTDDGAPR